MIFRINWSSTNGYCTKGARMSTIDLQQSLILFSKVLELGGPLTTFLLYKFQVKYCSGFIKKLMILFQFAEKKVNPSWINNHEAKFPGLFVVIVFFLKQNWNCVA